MQKLWDILLMSVDMTQLAQISQDVRLCLPEKYTTNTLPQKEKSMCYFKRIRILWEKANCVARLIVRRFNIKTIIALPSPYLPGSREWGDHIPKSAVSDPPFPLLMLTLFNEVSPQAALSWICSRCRCLSWLATLALFMGEPGRSKHTWMRKKKSSLSHDWDPSPDINK